MSWPKPRLYFRAGWWHCETPAPYFNHGIGRTPYAAYFDWQYP